MNTSTSRERKGEIVATAGHFWSQQFLCQRSKHVSDGMLTALYNEFVAVSRSKMALEQTHQPIPLML